MSTSAPTRRALLGAGLGLGVTIEFAAAPVFADAEQGRASKRLVVVICRGGLDGLSLTPPVGDANYAGLRGPIAIPAFGAEGGALKLDETFGLHPAMAFVHALALKGEARIAPAVATPDRERSHFEAQDVLESGATSVYGTSAGWLNRTLTAMGGRPRALSVGPTAPLILRGPFETASWSPGGGAQIDHRLPAILQDLYANDPALAHALADGLAADAVALSARAELPSAQMTNEAQSMAAGSAYAPILKKGLPEARRLGATVAAFMTAPAGAQIVAVSIDNFDTHANQGASQGQLAGRLAYLDNVLGGLADGMGPAWKDTIVVSVTEFGRTARVNGTRGTDHGTASSALVMGGALRRGGLIGDWPTLAPARLYEARDTAPTLDMRGLFKGVLADHLAIERRTLDTVVFPGSGAIAPAAGIV
ncbi:MAG TPA: DUF1501 domain-containing protein [Caulobacteraceae bacterium]|jgi:uncharacterized protein (DUF1501 family)|nr:DUF1501 domain-containing protein [Caulobacteraceae bacterium]